MPNPTPDEEDDKLIEPCLSSDEERDNEAAY